MLQNDQQRLEARARRAARRVGLMARKSRQREHVPNQRVNRKLAADDEVIRQSKPVYDRAGGDTERLRPIYDQNLGKYYRIDTRRNFLIEKDVDLEGRAREIGALQGWEELAPEAG
jgi:hypothetical protein